MKDDCYIPPPSTPHGTHTGNKTGTDVMQMTENSTSSSQYRLAAIITAVVCIVVMTITISLVLSVVLCCFRGNRRVRRRAVDVEIGQPNSRISSFGSYGTDCCEAIIPQGTSGNCAANTSQHKYPVSMRYYIVIIMLI